MNYLARFGSIFIMHLIFCFPDFVSAQTSGNLLKITDNLYMISGLGGNVSFLVTSQGVLVVDAGTLPRDGITIQNYIKKVTYQPIKYIILTHYHYDHAFGLCAFNKEIKVIAHENTMKNLNRFGNSSKDFFCSHIKKGLDESRIIADSLKKNGDPKWTTADSIYQSRLEDYIQATSIELCLPDTTFKNELELVMGRDTVLLSYPGATHSDGNIIVIFKNQHTIATGDLFFNQLMPYIDYEAGSNTLNWIIQTRALSAKDYRYVIPGHGLLAGGKKISQQADYLSDLRNMVEALMKQGKRLDEIKIEIKLEKYRNYGYKFMLPAEIEAIYYELKKIN